MGNQVLYAYMENYAYGDRRTHMGITVCIRAGIAKIFAYGDPHSHNKIVRILEATYAWTEAGLTDQPLWIEAVSVEQPWKGADYYLVDPTVFWITIEYHETDKDS